MRLERVFMARGPPRRCARRRTLADVACLSPYHFHRIYHSMQGETVTETVRRLRLPCGSRVDHRASCRCIASRRAGYGSREGVHARVQTAYTRAARRYRAASSLFPTAGKPEDAMESTMTYQTTIREAATIRSRPFLIAATIRRSDPRSSVWLHWPADRICSALQLARSGSTTTMCRSRVPPRRCGQTHA